MTDYDQTDTYLSVRKVSGNKGGARFRAYTDAAGGDPAFLFTGYIASDSDQSYVPISLLGGEANGTSAQNIAADRRIVEFKNADGTRIASFTGTGLCFGDDHSSSNALHDYEEGSWSPTLHDASGNNSSFNSVTNANYTKIGDTVRLSMRAVNMLS